MPKAKTICSLFLLLLLRHFAVLCLDFACIFFGFFVSYAFLSGLLLVEENGGRVVAASLFKFIQFIWPKHANILPACPHISAIFGLSFLPLPCRPFEPALFISPSLFCPYISDIFHVHYLLCVLVIFECSPSIIYVVPHSFGSFAQISVHSMPTLIVRSICIFS